MRIFSRSVGPVAVLVLAAGFATVGLPQATAQGAGPEPVPGIQPANMRATESYIINETPPMPTRYRDGTQAAPPTTPPKAITVRGLVPASSQATSATCTPGSGRDNPHIAETSVWAVSGHGWWTKGNCKKNSAKVWNCLYEWYTDNSWRRKACSGTLTLPPGGGGGNRTTAQRDCETSDRTDWRNHVDVNVIDEADTGEWPYNQANPPCRVFGADV